MSNPVGRPTDYDPKYCDIALESFGQGNSIAHLAKTLGVARVTIYRWAEKHPEFSNALERGREMAESHWEDLGKDMLLAGQFKEGCWKYFMANRFGWRDKMESENVTKIEDNREVDESNLTPGELEELHRLQAKAQGE